MAYFDAFSFKELWNSALAFQGVHGPKKTFSGGSWAFERDLRGLYAEMKAEPLLLTIVCGDMYAHCALLFSQTYLIICGDKREHCVEFQRWRGYIRLYWLRSIFLARTVLDCKWRRLHSLLASINGNIRLFCVAHLRLFFSHLNRRMHAERLRKYYMFLFFFLRMKHVYDLAVIYSLIYAQHPLHFASVVNNVATMRDVICLL